MRWGTGRGHTAQLTCGYGGDGVVEMQGWPDVMAAAVRCMGACDASVGASAHLGAIEPCRDCGWRGVIGVLSTLGVHWEDVLACVLCTAECVMYVRWRRVRVNSKKRRGDSRRLGALFCLCMPAACMVCAEWVHRFGEHATCVYIMQAEDAESI